MTLEPEPVLKQTETTLFNQALELHKLRRGLRSGLNEADTTSKAHNGQATRATPVKRFFRHIKPERLRRRIRKEFQLAAFSSLARRIVVLNLMGLVALVTGILLLNQSRTSLIEERVQRLTVEGKIIAGAIASSATVETDTITLDPELLLESQGTGDIYALSDTQSNLRFPINPEEVAPVLRTLITPTGTRARIYDNEGELILDSRNIYARGELLRRAKPASGSESAHIWSQFWRDVIRWSRSGEFDIYQELGGANGKGYAEVITALTGSVDSVTRISKDGELIVSVAVPIQRFNSVLGVLLLSTPAGDIDKIINENSRAIFQVFLVAALVMFLLSILLASTIAGPMRRLSAGAQRVARSIKARAELPDFTDRSDEIGDLSQSLTAMTNALYNRIEAIESFAADVAHELKNPLTSLKSAVETFPLVKKQADRDRLFEIVQHDIKRLDRLICDISDASRLDAELVRNDMGAVDIKRLIEAVVSMMDYQAQKQNVALKIVIEGDKVNNFKTLGHDGRLGQVVTNLVDNALSFSKSGSEVCLALKRDDKKIVLDVKDSGPGIQAQNIDKIFERFYTDRPGEDNFGQNSGLGLSISRQIIEAHHGTLTARNHQDGGAVFTVQLNHLEKN